MKKKDIILEVSSGGKPWEEEYSIPKDKSEQEWAEEIVSYFNSTRREGERLRTLVSVRLAGNQNKKVSKKQI